MEQLHARHVILGAGAMGSATAYHLARRGEPVLLVEQFRVGHDRGSSHGAARITRHSYADSRYARLMPEAFRGWRELEADAAQNLYVRTGGVSFCPGHVDYVARVCSSLESIGVPHRRLTGAQLRRSLPVLTIPESYDAVFEPDAGLLAASRIVATQVELARRHGGAAFRLLEECPIRRIDLDGDRPTLVADDLRITADRLIVTAGAWAARLLPWLGVPLRPTRQQVLYLRPSDVAPFSIGRFPVFISLGQTEPDTFYGMPDYLGAGVKVARNGGPVVNPEAVDRVIGDEYRGVVGRFLRGHIPALADAPIAHTEVCLYTMAPGEEFLVDFLPGRSDLIVASPCSGHGFKFSNLVGRVLADLALDGRTDVAIDPWRLRGRCGPP
jgi:sarcosine oxidase